jgi:hypothetical protein
VSTELQRLVADGAAANLTAQRIAILSEARSAVNEDIIAVTCRLEDRLDGLQASHVSCAVRCALGAAANGGGDDADASAQEAVAVTVRAVLLDVFKARTQGVDWLLAANGASIIDSSTTYTVGCWRWFGWPRRAGPGLGPEALLRVSLEKPAAAAVAAVAHGSGSVDPGQCWAMAGAQGWATVRLARTVTPSRLVLQHIPAHVSLNACHSSPQTFWLIGLLAPLQTMRGAGTPSAGPGPRRGCAGGCPGLGWH